MSTGDTEGWLKEFFKEVQDEIGTILKETICAVSIFLMLWFSKQITEVLFGEELPQTAHLIERISPNALLLVYLIGIAISIWNFVVRAARHIEKPHPAIIKLASNAIHSVNDLLAKLRTDIPKGFRALSFIILPAFLGLLIGDMGYGLILLLIAVVIRVLDRRKRIERVDNILISASVSTIFFGFLFWEFFGQLPRQVLFPFWPYHLQIGFARTTSAFFASLGLVVAYEVALYDYELYLYFIRRRRGELTQRRGILPSIPLLILSLLGGAIVLALVLFGQFGVALVLVIIYIAIFVPGLPKERKISIPLWLTFVYAAIGIALAVILSIAISPK